MTDFGLKRILHFRITWQTIKDYWRTSLILTLFVIALAAMYAGMFPSMKDTLPSLINTFKDNPMMAVFDVEQMNSYIGFLNVEFYDVFWVLVFGIMIGFITASQISKEIESKTIDLLMSNPVSRKQIVFEKFVGLIPLIIMINLAAIFTIWGTSVLINEDINLWYLSLTHVVSIIYFMAIASVGLFVSVIINEKMKASIVMILFVFLSYFINMIGKMLNNDSIRIFSLKKYYETIDILKYGNLDIQGIVILCVFTILIMITSLIYFEHKDIAA